MKEYGYCKNCNTVTEGTYCTGGFMCDRCKSTTMPKSQYTTTTDCRCD